LRASTAALLNLGTRTEFPCVRVEIAGGECCALNLGVHGSRGLCADFGFAWVEIVGGECCALIWSPVGCALILGWVCVGRNHGRGMLRVDFGCAWVPWAAR
jgi:hypothetical protein